MVAASKARHFASMFIVASRFVIALVRKLGMILFANNSWGRCYHSQRKVSCVFTQIILRLYDASEYRRVMFMYTVIGGTGGYTCMPVYDGGSHHLLSRHQWIKIHAIVVPTIVVPTIVVPPNKVHH